MGEIKSTIELVLEKTRGLTLDKEEKANLKKKKLTAKIHGLTNKYVDNFFPLRRLQQEIEQLINAGQKQGLVLNLLKNHLVNHLDPDEDNSAIFSALSVITGFDVSLITTHQKEYLSGRGKAEKKFTDKALSSFKERAVSGTAVVPNLNRSKDWNHLQDNLRATYRKSVEGLLWDGETGS